MFVNILKPGEGKSFQVYSDTVFNPVALSDIQRIEDGKILVIYWHQFGPKLPEAVKPIQKLIKYGCKKGSRKACKCEKANLLCTELCACNGDCKSYV